MTKFTSSGLVQQRLENPDNHWVIDIGGVSLRLYTNIVLCKYCRLTVVHIACIDLG